MNHAPLTRLLTAVAILAARLAAQETVAPTNGTPVGPVRGENSGDYNIVQSWELGYRFASIGGNQQEYRNLVNYFDGVRLLGSSLTVNSKDGRGRFFDDVALTTQGLGNDPFESAVLRVGKNRLYRYDMTWRRNTFFDPGLTVTLGEHLQNTTYDWQDHELTLFPQRAIRVHMGYGRVTEDGPALTTEQEFDDRGNVYPTFRSVRRQFNDYRLGADGAFHGFRFTVQKRWEYFREDTADLLSTPETGVVPGQLNSFNRTQPYRGRTPAWSGSLFGENHLLAANAHFTYAGGKADFAQDETAIGLDRFGNAQNVQTLVTGAGDRPVTTGELSLTFLPEGRFNLIEDASVSNTRMLGNNFFEQFNDATLQLSTVQFQLLAIRLITSATDLRYRFSKTLDAFAGYRFATRQVRSIEDLGIPGGPLSGIAASQTNETDSGVAGLNWLPIKNLRLHLEGEVGRNSRPFAPISLRNYHAIRSRIQYRARNLVLNGGYREDYNNNSIAITAYSSRARNYSADASWNLRSGIAIDAAWSKLHLDTIGGIAFFAGSPSPQQMSGESIYISNIHTGNLGLRFSIANRVDLYLGYSITKDTGDGRGSPAALPNPVAQVFSNAQTFPLTYQSPLARISIRLSEKLRYNFGYQYYGYNEQFGLFSVYENFHANTGYTSLLWSF